MIKYREAKFISTYNDKRVKAGDLNWEIIHQGKIKSCIVIKFKISQFKNLMFYLVNKLIRSGNINKDLIYFKINF